MVQLALQSINTNASLFVHLFIIIVEGTHHPLPPPPPLCEGFDILVCAHVHTVGLEDSEPSWVYYSEPP